MSQVHCCGKTAGEEEEGGHDRGPENQANRAVPTQDAALSVQLLLSCNDLFYLLVLHLTTKYICLNEPLKNFTVRAWPGIWKTFLIYRQISTLHFKLYVAKYVIRVPAGQS